MKRITLAALIFTATLSAAVGFSSRSQAALPGPSGCDVCLSSYRPPLFWLGW